MNSERTIEIKPCPFCGSKDVRVIHQMRTYSISKDAGADVECCIVCNDCNCQTVMIKGYEFGNGTSCIKEFVGKPFEYLYYGSTLDFALSVWNRRA